MEAEFLSLEGEFTIRNGQKLYNYTRIADIPEKFDHLIKFLPKYPESPHTIEEHARMNRFTDHLYKLQERELH